MQRNTEKRHGERTIEGTLSVPKAMGREAAAKAKVRDRGGVYGLFHTLPSTPHHEHQAEVTTQVYRYVVGTTEPPRLRNGLGFSDGGSRARVSTRHLLTRAEAAISGYTLHQPGQDGNHMLDDSQPHEYMKKMFQSCRVEPGETFMGRERWKTPKVKVSAASGAQM